jgi:hypothetical protein
MGMFRKQPVPRAARRIPLERQATLRSAETGEVITSTESNISIDGVFVATPIVKPPGTIFHFDCNLAYTKIEGLVEVVWFREQDQGPEHPAGMGMQFVELSPESRKLIYKLIDGYIRQGGTPDMGQFPDDTQAPPAPEAPAVAAEEIALEEELPVTLPVPEQGTGVPGPWGARLSRSARRRWTVPLALLLVLVAGVYFFPERVRQLLPFGRQQPQAPESLPAELPPSQTPSPDQEVDSPPPEETVVVEASEPAAEQISERVARDGAPPEPGEPVPAKAAETAFAMESEPDTPSVEALAPVTRIDQIRWRREAQGLLVVIEANGTFTPSDYSHLRIEEGAPREVIRIYGVLEPYQATVLQVNAPELRRIRSGHHTGPNGGELHVVLDLAGRQFRLTEIEEAGEQLLLHVSPN